eukprot:766890-Hanusia_phi.AAC.2
MILRMLIRSIPSFSATFGHSKSDIIEKRLSRKCRRPSRARAMLAAVRPTCDIISSPTSSLHLSSPSFLLPLLAMSSLQPSFRLVASYRNGSRAAVLSLNTEHVHSPL